MRQRFALFLAAVFLMSGCGRAAAGLPPERPDSGSSAGPPAVRCRRRALPPHPPLPGREEDSGPEGGPPGRPASAAGKPPVTGSGGNAAAEFRAPAGTDGEEDGRRAERESGEEEGTRRGVPPAQTASPPDPLRVPESPAGAPLPPDDPEIPDPPAPPVPSDRLTVKNTDDGTVRTGEAREIVACALQNEIGGGFPPEAIKALGVATYSYIRFLNSLGKTAELILKPDPDPRIYAALDEVAGEAVYYDGEIANCVYFAVSAGCTTSAKNVWGTDYPYLVSVESPLERDSGYDVGWSAYRRETVFSPETVAAKCNAALGTALDPVHGDPSGWFEILSHTDGLYVGEIRVGDVTVTGRRLRENVLHLRSHAFTVGYSAEDRLFTFTTYGYGHGVGLSAVGALCYAESGWSYRDILTHYYSGVEIR